jgi:hypothetical protein
MVILLHLLLLTWPLFLQRILDQSSQTCDPLI